MIAAVKLLPRLFVLFSVVLSSFALAQTAQTELQSQGPVAKDARTRAKIHTELGALYYQDRNIPVAMEEFTIAIHIDPDYAPAYAMRGLVHWYLKEADHADDNFKQAWKLAPDDPEIANNYGWFLCQVGRPKEGLPLLMRAISNRLYQTPDRAYLNAADCALQMNELGMAGDFAEKAYRYSAGTPAATLKFAEIRYKQGLLDEARVLIGNLIRVVDPSPAMLWLAVRIERKRGDRESEGVFASQLRRKYSASPEYQELLKGNYE